VTTSTFAGNVAAASAGKVTRERRAGRVGTSGEDICLRHASIKPITGLKKQPGY
jgi:hypothetical protein